MEVSCPECGHGLWSEEVLVADRYGVWSRIDDEQRSDSYAEHLWAVSGARFLNARTR